MLSNNYDAVAVGTRGAPGKVVDGTPLVGGHAYTVMYVTRNALSVVTSITLRNPWGVDGAGSDNNPKDGLVTVNPNQLYRSTNLVYWGHVGPSVLHI